MKRVKPKKKVKPKQNKCYKPLNQDGRTFKIATEKGKEIGIYSEDRESEARGHYIITLYNSEAQKYLLRHLEEITHN